MGWNHTTKGFGLLRGGCNVVLQDVGQPLRRFIRHGAFHHASTRTLSHIDDRIVHNGLKRCVHRRVDADERFFLSHRVRGVLDLEMGAALWKGIAQMKMNAEHFSRFEFEDFQHEVWPTEV